MPVSTECAAALLSLRYPSFNNDSRSTLHAAKTMRGPRAARALRVRPDYKLAFARVLRALALREIIADIK